MADGDLATGNEFVASVRKFAETEGASVVVVSAQVESELVDLDGDDKREFLESLGTVRRFFLFLLLLLLSASSFFCFWRFLLLVSLFFFGSVRCLVLLLSFVVDFFHVKVVASLELSDTNT